MGGDVFLVHNVGGVGVDTRSGHRGQCWDFLSAGYDGCIVKMA